MRLWHYQLLKNDLLPDTQIKELWKKLNMIYQIQPKDLLINYIYEYDKAHLYNYSQMVIYQMKKLRQKNGTPYKIDLTNFNKYFGDCKIEYIEKPFEKDHNDEYLRICYWDLRERYLRKQKDFTKEKWWGIYNFCKDKLFYKGEN